MCAADKENAGIVFRSAVFMLETAPWTAKMVAAGDLKIIRSQKRIEFYQRQRADNGRMDRVMVGQLQVLPAEAYESNEQNGIEYVNYTLLGYETQWSQEDSYKLLLPGERARGLRIKRELKVFLRGDTEAQSAYYTALRNVGALNPDEIRALEDMGGIPGGDSYYASWNYGPLDQWARLSVLRAMGKAGAVPPMEGGEEDG